MAFIPDAPSKLSFVPDKPAAIAAPPSSNPFVREGQSQLSDIGDVSDAAITSLLNMPHNAWHAIKDLASSATGQGVVPKTAGPAALSPTTVADLQPGPMGQAAISGVKSADTALENAAPTVHNVLHHAGRVAGDVLDIANMVAPAKAGFDAASALTTARTAIPQTMEEALTAVGYRNLPRQGEGSAAAKAGAKITGEPPLAQQQTLTNQAVDNVLAKHESGVPQGQDLDYANLAKSRINGPGKVYNAAEAAMPDTMVHDPELQGALRNVGDTTSQLPKSPDVDALKEAMLSQPNMTRAQLFKNIQQARDRASRFYASDQPDAHAIGDAYQGVANAYEDFVGRQLANTPGASVSLADWQNARTAFAKNYAVQGAVRGTSVNGAKLAAIQAKDPEKLTGGLRLIAEQHNRYPLSSGFGPMTFEPGGVGASGTPQGIIARHVTGPMLGGGIGALFGGPMGAAIGGASGLLASEGLQSVIRKALGGNPAKSAALAEAATKNPDLAHFFDQAASSNPAQTPPLNLQPPPGHAFEPHQPDLATGASPTELPFEQHVFDLQQAPGQAFEPHQPELAAGTPYQRPTRTPRELQDMAAQPSLIDQLGSFSPTQRTLERERVASLRAREEGITPEFEPEPIPAGAAEREGTAARRAGGGPSLMDLLENLKDHPDVMSQGVPEGIMQRSGVRAQNDLGGAVTNEAANRQLIERASGQDRFLIDQDGKMWPIRGIEAADATAPKGSIIVQKGVGGSPYTILDRGGLPRAHANGLMNRALAGGHGMTLMDLLEGGGG